MTKLGSFHEHLAGIIPMAGPKLELGFPWDDALTPIGKNFFAIERSVFECVLAGCHTIWIVCPFDMQVAVRQRLGDYVRDPAGLRKGLPTKADFEDINQIFANTEIPIFYIRLPPEDELLRRSFAWNIIYAMHCVQKTDRAVSFLLNPEKYYICFPHSLYPIHFLARKRKIIRQSDFFFVRHKGKTVCDGELLGFTIRHMELEGLQLLFRTVAMQMWLEDNKLANKKRVAAGERPLGPRPRPKVLVINEDHVKGNFTLFQRLFGPKGIFPAWKQWRFAYHDVSWHHNLFTWDSYKQYLLSEESKLIERPKRAALKLDYKLYLDERYAAYKEHRAKWQIGGKYKDNSKRTKRPAHYKLKSREGTKA